LRKIFIPDLGE